MGRDPDDGILDVASTIRRLVRRGNVTLEERDKLHCNLREWEALLPALNDEAFDNWLRYVIDNCDDIHPGEVLQMYVVELMKRYRSHLLTRTPIRSFDDLNQACKNIGFDLSCGECAAIFFTGSGGYSHDDSCTTHSAARGYAETIDNVREALGQVVTHYLIVADDVKELVEAVEKHGGPAAEVLQKIRERGAASSKVE